MGLEELIEKITDIKKSLIEFNDLVFECEETIIDDRTWLAINTLKENAYDNLVEIKDILLELQSNNN